MSGHLEYQSLERHVTTMLLWNTYSDRGWVLVILLKWKSIAKSWFPSTPKMVGSEIPENNTTKVVIQPNDLCFCSINKKPPNPNLESFENKGFTEYGD